MRMTLRPESLGDIVLRVLTQNGIVTAQFEAESQRVKEALEASFNQLRDALTEQGIAFSELSVSVRQGQDERMNQFDHARQKVRGRIESVENAQEEPEPVSYHSGVIDVTA
jgi:flagellar hook-length control protein FliK